MAKTPEGEVKKQIRAWLKARGIWKAGDPRPERVRGWYYMPANNGMGVSGIPDFMGHICDPLLGAQAFAIEAKKPGGKPTPLQLDRHAELRATGAVVLVVDDVSQLAELERML